MTEVFLAGALADGALLQRVLPGAVALPAYLPAHRVLAAPDHPFGHLAPGEGAAAGVVVSGLSGPELARLDHIHACLGLTLAEGAPQAGGARAPLRLWSGPHLADAPDWTPGPPGPAAAFFEELMRLRGDVAPDVVRTRLGPLSVQAASRARAQGGAADPRRVNEVFRSTPYARLFAVEEYDLSYPRFDGCQGPAVRRAVFVSGDAVTVLPYDPARDRVLVVEQFRAGPHARGDRSPWQMEAVAGRIDAGETPEQAARREAAEEAGLALSALLPVAEYYPSPGAVSEYLYSYVALCDLPDGIAGVHGLAEEAEDIKGHLLAFPTFLEWVASGRITNAPLLLTALWLERERPRLRRGA